MGRLLSGLLLLNLIIACGEKLPRGVVSKKELPDLLVELHLLDANLTTIPIDSARMQMLPAYESIFEFYNIDSTIFVQTIEYYAKRPTDFQEIYKVVNERLQTMVDEGNAKRAAEFRQQMVADSLRNIRLRDSLILVARDSLDLRRKRHLLLNHEADSTLDRQVPVNFVNYSIRLFEDLGLWRLNFDPFVKLDSTLELGAPVLPILTPPIHPDVPALPAVIPPAQRDTLRQVQQRIITIR